MNDDARNPFGSTAVAERHTAALPARGGETASAAVAAQARAMIESRYVMAIRNPRNLDQVRQDLLKECSRPSFAHNKSALYVKPIGKGVEGLGIRFVEVALRCYRNVLSESVMVYADEEREIHRVCVTDLENNCTWPMDITVNRTVERSKPSDDGSYISVRKNSFGRAVYTVPATDDELLNKRQALISKAMRTAGLRVIPGDLQDEAEALIRKIRLDAASADPDAEKRKITDAFTGLGVRADDLQDYLGHSIDGCTPAELVELRGLYGALKDGEATWLTVMDNKRSIAAASVGNPTASGAKTGSSALAAAAKKTARTPLPKPATEVEDDPDLTQDIPSSAPTITYEKLHVRLQNAHDIDVLDADASLIGTIEGQDRQNNLAHVYKRRRAELNGA